MGDSVRTRGVGGAIVTVGTDGHTEQLTYNAADGYYRSPTGMRGVAGNTYQLHVELDGRQYEATSTMPPAATILSTQFVWQPVINNGILMYVVQARDPQPDVDNYYRIRMDRRATDPKVRRKQSTDAYRLSQFDERGIQQGLLLRDVMCVNEEMMDGKDIDDDQLKSILFEGDTVTLQLWTIDRPSYDYFRTLSAGQRMGANPHTNITGGCQGYFTAASITHADTVVYRSDIIVRLQK